MRARYLLLAIIAYLATLLVTAPANWAAFLINRMSSGALTLARPAGGFWRGQGRLYLKDPRPLLLGTLSWRVDPAALLVGRAQAALALAGPIRFHATVACTWNRLMLHGLSVTLPASRLASFDPSLRLLKPSGVVRLESRTFALAPAGAAGTAELTWTSAGTALSTLKPLGDYRIQLQGAGTRMRLTLQTLRGALGLSGQGQWDRGGVFRFGGLATASGTDPRALRLVRLLGRRLRPHVHVFSVTARTPPWNQLF
ncbi:MAG: type II secretion system protein N [Acidiferrobacteraceae bacterium]